MSSADPSVIAALEAAVAADPANPALRTHLASLLVMAGDPARALEHAQAALARAPDDTEALLAARDAAQALGDRDRAAGYERLLGAERVALPATPDDAPPPETLPEDGAERAGVTLADVGGLEVVKQRLDAAFLAPLRNPELRSF